MKCPRCGYAHTMEQPDEQNEVLWYCNYCYLWWFLYTFGNHLPREAPYLTRLKKRIKDSELCAKDEET